MMNTRNLLVIGLSALLAACGFQLRGTGSESFALSEIDLQARDSHGETRKQLQHLLENSQVHVHPGAPYQLYLASERETQRAASYTSSGRSVEYALKTELDYQIRGRNKLLLLEDRLEAHSTYVHDANNLIGTGAESTQLRQEMRRELVQQLALRLRQISPQQLEQLQQQAEARAEAEAQAAAAARQAEAQSAPLQSPIELPTQP